MDLVKTLRLHQMWLMDEEDGKRANLTGADLRGADLRGADLRGANLTGADLTGADLTEADLTGANLTEADLTGANLTGADLRGADLTEADLRGADLRGANLDYAVWPMWCGSFDVEADRRLAAQLAYHFCRIDFGDDVVCLDAQDALVTLANEFHRVVEHGVPPIKQRGRSV